MGLSKGIGTTPDGLVATVAWQIGDHLQQAFEGNILASGATLAWLSRLLGRDVTELTLLARQAPDDHGVVLVPAMAGLGAPHWDPDARAILVGFDLGTDPGILARAAMEAIVQQVTDVVEAAASRASIETILADGGPASDDFLMSLQAEAAHRTVRRPTLAGLSARGVAQMATESLGGSFSPLAADVFEPNNQVAVSREQWTAALQLAKEH